MKIKICGLNDSTNILDIIELKPNYVGFIFYERSPRFINNLDPIHIINIPSLIKKVGVFVNENINSVIEIARIYNLDYIQLHGTESPSYCEELKKKNIKVIKAFGIDCLFDFRKLQFYLPYCDMFLFDTKTTLFGGSGNSFDWTLLNKFKFEMPFLLSGGLDQKSIDKIYKIKHPQLLGVDLNSKIEDEPGVKNILKTKLCIQQIKKI